MTISVQSDIPIPNKRDFRPRKYPWIGMQVGDSFFGPNINTNSMTSCARNALGKGNYKLLTTTENGVEGVRVWRIG